MSDELKKLEKRVQGLERLFDRTPNPITVEKKLEALEKKLTTFQTKYPYTTAFENSKQIAELKAEMNAFVEIKQMPCSDCKLNDLEAVLRELGDHYRENLEYIKNHSGLWDFNIEELDELLDKLDSGGEKEVVAEKGSNPRNYEVDTTGVAEVNPTDSKLPEVMGHPILYTNEETKELLEASEQTTEEYYNLDKEAEPEKKNKK